VAVTAARGMLVESALLFLQLPLRLRLLLFLLRW
jgi:hypothetical protein